MDRNRTRNLPRNEVLIRNNVMSCGKRV